MRTRIMTILFCTLLLVAAGCKKDRNEPGTTASESIAGGLPEPDWSVGPDYDLTASMTAVVKVDLALSYPAQVAAMDGHTPDGSDVLAVFAGDVCAGVATLTDGLFYLYIAGVADEGAEDLRLRYYSATLKNIFVSTETFPFRNDTRLGTVSAPYTPAFVTESASR